MIFCPGQSHGHSAHIGQEVEVYYRWHALYGRRVRRQYVERRAGGEVVHVEVAPGNVVVVAAWMLDAAACAGMELGTPRVTIAALTELHRLLAEHGFRRRSSDGSTIVREKQREKPVDLNAAIGNPAPAQHPVRFDKATRHDRCGAPNFARPAGQSAARGRRPHRRGE